MRARAGCGSEVAASLSVAMWGCGAAEVVVDRESILSIFLETHSEGVAGAEEVDLEVFLRTSLVVVHPLMRVKEAGVRI